jgi:hypothetical protein
MSFAEISTVLAGLTFGISSILYVRDTIKAKITPSIATFGILTVVNISQLIALISKEVWHVVPFTTVGFLQALIVFIVAIKGGRFYFRLVDLIAVIGAIVGFILWLTHQDAAYNIYILNAVIAITFIPLITKAFKEPALETKLPWRSNLLASVFLLFTITSTAPYVWIVPVRQFLCSLLVNIGISIPNSAKKSRRLS